MTQIQCYDYYVFDAEHESYDDLNKLESDLKNMGKHGWNMCGVYPDDGLIFFKKPIDTIHAYSGGDQLSKREFVPRPRRRTSRDEIVRGGNKE